MIKKNVRFLVVVAAVIAVVIAAWLLFRSEKDPRRRFAQLLSQQDIHKPNIIFITLDTTRADRLGCYGYTNVETPFIDKLAEKGILFEQCISPIPLTLPSHCSMMTGLYPTFHGVRVNGNTALSQQHQTMAEVFAQQGYQCGAFIAAFVLDGRWGLKQGFHHYDDQFDLKKYKQLDLAGVQRPGNQVMDAALAWLEEQKQKPFFAWIHLYDPHTPYEPPEPYRSAYNNGTLSGLYDGEIAFTDTQVGRCISWLEQNGLDKSTILVIMGDHGEGLGEHGELTHGYYIYEYAIHVPFLIKTPFKQLQGIRFSLPVSTIDLYPTLLEMMGVQVPGNIQGKSLLPTIFGGESKEETYSYSESLSPNLQYGWSALHSLRTSQYKYIDAPRAEFYELSKDPKERNNLTRRFPGLVKQFKSRLTRLMDETSTGAPAPESANLDQETLKRLATLGYIGAPIKRKSSKGKGLADPKDKLEIFQKIALAGEQILHEKYSEAAVTLETVLQEDPNIPQAKLILSTCYVELGRGQEAKTLLDSILKDDPNNIQALISMANILLDQENNEDVITLCKKAIAVDDRNTQAYTLIGEVYMGDNDHEKALPYLEKAVEIQPKLTQNRQNLAVCLIGLKRYNEAEVMLKDIILKTPKFPLAHFHMGLLSEEQGRFEQAREAYAREVELYSHCVPARFNLGKLLLRLGDRQAYLEQMQEVVRLAPKLADGYLFLARGLLLESGDPDHILQLVQKGLSFAKKPQMQALGYFLLADIYNRKHQPQKVQEALEQANFYKNKQ
jgi:arylsulfatase A-like enzyme/tetratricopeptide (TPR) repeat protein